MENPGTPAESSNVLALPSPFLAHLIQHVASGPRGLASAAALSQTCKLFHALSDSPAVIYRNICVKQPISYSDHRIWQWLARRKGRVAGLKLEILVDTPAHSFGNEFDPEDTLGWEQVLQLLSNVTGLDLTVVQVDPLSAPDHPFIRTWLKPHGHIIDHLTARVYTSAQVVPSKIFEPVAACKAVCLSVLRSPVTPLDLTNLAPMVGSLVELRFNNDYIGGGNLSQLSTFSSLSHLTKLHIQNEDFTAEDLWGPLAGLRNLKQLSLEVAASGDPAPLSALTALSSLQLRNPNIGGVPRFSFSSLQPLSTLQQLEVLELHQRACTSTSLQGLGGLSKLTRLVLAHANNLVSLDGVSTSLRSLSITDATALECLTAVEPLSLIEELDFNDCDSLASLPSLASLGRLTSLLLFDCDSLSSLEGLEGAASTCLRSLRLLSCQNLIQVSAIAKLQALQGLEMFGCGVTSLQPLAGLPKGMRRVMLHECISVQEDVLELPHVQPTAAVFVRDCNVKEMVLAGGVRRMLG